ncbi:MAG: hypothetical protein LC111_13350 [Bacteroidia bacterium]|nr:hypothetical protein [Bacteroidia bacterium]
MKLIFFRLLLFSIISTTLWSCAPTRSVLPLCYKENLVSASVGGPIIHYGKNITPIPYTSVTYSRGLSDTTTVFASFHPTAAVFGTFQMEVGMNRYIINNDSAKYAVTIAPILNFMRRDSINKFYPQIDVNFIKRSALHDNYFYAGLCNWFEMATQKINGDKQRNIWFPSPQVGYVWNTKKGLMFQTELKYLVPYKRNDYGPVEYLKPLIPYGGLGVYIGAAYKF